MSAVLALDLGPSAGRPDFYAARRGNRVAEYECDHCHQKYLHYIARAARSKHHYCSNACYKAARSGPLNPKWRGGAPQRVCKHCGKSFAMYEAKSRTGSIKYCGFICKVAAQTKYRTRKEARREWWRRRELAERRAATLGHHTPAEWEALLDQHGHRCAHCGTTERLTRDHIIPLSKGGSDLIENIQPLCHRCNARKGARVA